MKNKPKIVFLWLGVLALIGGFTIDSLLQSQKPFLERYQLSHMTTVEIVNHLEAITNEPPSFRANITGTTLYIGDSKESLSLPLPEDQFYLSVAPYLDHTHPCGIHNLVTCTGELTNQSFRVTVYADDNENILVDEVISTSAKGFMGIWLPRNIEGTLVVENDHQSASTSITTYDDSNTCLTTLKLQSR
jgi:hypothetical protein